MEQSRKKEKRRNKNGEVEKMARKDDILSIYTKEVEGIKEAGLFQRRGTFCIPAGSKSEDGRWKRTSLYVCE